MTAPMPLEADIRGWLRQLTDTHLKSTPGPWATYWGDHLGSGVTKLPAGGVMVDHFITTIADEDYRADSDNKPNPADPSADAASIVSAHNALMPLVAALTAVLDLADELERPGSEAGRYLAARIRAAVAAYRAAQDGAAEEAVRRVEALAEPLDGKPTREDRAVAEGLVRRARAAKDDDERDAAREAIALEIATERAIAAVGGAPS